MWSVGGRPQMGSQVWGPPDLRGQIWGTPYNNPRARVLGKLWGVRFWVWGSEIRVLRGQIRVVTKYPQTCQNVFRGVQKVTKNMTKRWTKNGVI